MELGLDMPSTFVVIGEMFDRELSLNVAEFEFPTYFNFFIKKKQVITSKFHFASFHYYFLYFSSLHYP